MSKCLSLCFLIFIVSYTPSMGQTKNTYKIGIASWVGWSFISVAEQQGFFDDAGVSVEVKWFKEPKDIQAAFEANQIDFRLDFVASVVHEIAKGKDLRLLGETNWSHGGDKIIGKKGLNIRSQKGSTIGIYRDSPALLYFLAVYLKRNGLNISDFTIKSMPLDILTEKFISGELKHIVVFDPYTIEAVQKGNGQIKGHSAQFPGCMPEGLYAKTERLAQIDEGDVVKILKACIQAENWINNSDNWPRFRYILNRHVFQDHEDFEDVKLKAMLRYVKIHSEKVLVNRNRPGGGLERYISDIIRFMNQAQGLKTPLSSKEILLSEPLLKAIQSK